MSLWIKRVLLGAALAGAALWLAQQWQRHTLSATVAAVEQAAYAAGAATAMSAAGEPLPAPVVRYLDHVLPAQRRPIRLARYRQAGTLRTDAGSERWMDFTATQIIAPARSAFAWDARVALMPMLHVRVLDSLVGGRGAGKVALLSAIPVSSAAGAMEMNSGSLHRFLAEAVWYPTALLPGPHLRWTPIDDRRALATLTDGRSTVSLEFRFNQADEVTGIYSPGRWGSFDGGYRQVAWEGAFRDYARRDGVLVPTHGEVGWYRDGKWQAVWKGTVFDAALEFE